MGSSSIVSILFSSISGVVSSKILSSIELTLFSSIVSLIGATSSITVSVIALDSCVGLASLIELFCCKFR